MKRSTILKIKQLLAIIACWMIAGFMISVYDHLVMYSHTSIGPSENYSFWLVTIRNMGGGLIGGLIGGSLLVFYINVKYQDKPYFYTIVAVSSSFILIVAFVTLLMGALIVPIETGKPLSDPTSKAQLQDFIVDSYPIKSALVWSFIVAITQLLLQVSSKFGHSVFWNIMFGKYNTPKAENRIFMFLDLNDSTTMAEQLGDENYHTLLKDFFADITDPILENKGHIYQYVGDEVVVAWKYADGIQNLQCLKCFYDLKLQIHKNKEKYLQRYGLVPTFKAGIHYGKVVAGEVGIIKRDITYSGDVLNTTSRILGKCAELKEEIITSSDLLSELQFAQDYLSRPLGAIKLKGKQKEVLLSALQPIPAF